MLIIRKILSTTHLVIIVINIITGIIKFSKNIIESLFTHVKTISQNQVKQIKGSFLENFYVHKNTIPEVLIRLFFYRLFKLHRKEVIHPHVLVGIPCYDFTPVTCPTLDDPLPCGLGYRLQVLQTPMA